MKALEKMFLLSLDNIFLDKTFGKNDLFTFSFSEYFQKSSIKIFFYFLTTSIEIIIMYFQLKMYICTSKTLQKEEQSSKNQYLYLKVGSLNSMISSSSETVLLTSDIVALSASFSILRLLRIQLNLIITARQAFKQ